MAPLISVSVVELRTECRPKGAVVVVGGEGEAEGGADDGQDAADGARAQDRIQEMMMVVIEKEGLTDLLEWGLDFHVDCYVVFTRLF